MVRGTKNTVLVDPDAKARLLLAAKAAGLETIAELADLVVDSGAVATVPDGVSEVYTLQDLGVQMHAQMPPQNRPQWFQGLVETQQCALIAMLRARGYSSMALGNDFNIDVVTINKIYAKYADALGAQVVNVRLTTLVGNLQIAAERAGEGAAGKDDWAAYWRIQKEMIAMLQSLGIVKQAIRKVEVAHSFGDQQKAEVDAMVDIEEKHRRRKEEIKTVEARVLDPVPELSPPVQGSMEKPFDE